MKVFPPYRMGSETLPNMLPQITKSCLMLSLVNFRNISFQLSSKSAILLVKNR